MKTNLHFWPYLAYVFLDWEMIQTKVVEKIKTHILYPIMFFSKIVPLWNNVETFCRPGQATDDNIIECMCIAFWIT